MPIFPRERIRLEVNTDAKAGSTGINDSVTGAAPDCWRGTAVQFELGFFLGGELLDISNFATVTLLGKDASNINGDKLIEKTISSADMDATLSQGGWDAGTGQHATIELTSEEMNIALNGQPFRELWLIIHGENLDGEPMVYGAARLRVYETGISSGNPPTPAQGSNLIAGGSVYNGSGQFTLTGLTSGNVYEWTKATNDSTLVNGTETLSSSDRFTAQGTSVVLTGSIGTAVTANVRGATYYTADEVNAKLDGLVKIFNKAGATIFVTSENGRYKVGFSASNDGEAQFPVIDTQAAP